MSHIEELKGKIKGKRVKGKEIKENNYRERRS